MSRGGLKQKNNPNRLAGWISCSNHGGLLETRLLGSINDTKKHEKSKNPRK
ncbi:hypothetical protein EMPG_10226 [Blastomyces silverae]|uniref:Uncharacterized protein n=1 Tax=Blastomyces silverae TaxID=2060906 RepID=A0A0H1B5Y2_9EURO|nr:hypothetical protein EMPG_10226 [Blastomyces silverae]